MCWNYRILYHTFNLGLDGLIMTQFEKTFSIMKKPVVIAIYAIIVVLVFLYIDKPLAIDFKQLDFRSNLHVLNILTTFGQWKIYVLVFFLAGIYFRFVQKNAVIDARAWYLLGCVFIVNVVGFAVKIAVSRARPDLLFSADQFGFYWFQMKDSYWSFPSGHSLTIASMVVGLGVIFPRYFYALFVFGILVAISRVLLFRHYLSDVMTGFYLGVLVVGFFTQYLKKNHYLDKIN